MGIYTVNGQISWDSCGIGHFTLQKCHDNATRNSQPARASQTGPSSASQPNQPNFCQPARAGQTSPSWERKEQAAVVFLPKSASQPGRQTSLILEERRKEQAAAVFPPKSASQPVRPNLFNILPRDSHEILDLLRSSCSTTKTFKLPLRLGKGVACFRTPPNLIATPPSHSLPTGCAFQSIMIWGSDLV